MPARTIPSLPSAGGAGPAPTTSRFAAGPSHCAGLRPAERRREPAGYCHYGWWRAIAEAGSVFVTRPNPDMGLRAVEIRPLAASRATATPRSPMRRSLSQARGDSNSPAACAASSSNGRTEPRSPSSPKTMTTAPSPSATFAKADGSSSISRSATAWVSARTPFACRVYAAMIAYGPPEDRREGPKITLPILRFGNLVGQCLFDRPKSPPDELHQCLIFPGRPMAPVDSMPTHRATTLVSRPVIAPVA
jgi:hypothetical protein